MPAKLRRRGAGHDICDLRRSRARAPGWYSATMARSGAKPGDWKTLPFPGPTGPLPFTRRFTADELRRLQQGLVPEDMGDKWFVVWHEDALWMHRSWTGHCIFRLRFAADGDGFVVAELLVNREPAQFHGTDHSALDMVNVVLDLVLRYARSA